MNKEEYKEAFTLIDLFANRGCDETDCCDCIAYNEKSNQFGVKNEKELQNIYLNKPYKLEDLKEGMRVYDIKYDEFCKIDFIAGIYIHRSYSDGTISDSPFEENRFFSTQCNLSHCIREVA